eukprot:53636-Prorocentrum_minimum.AAC.2
MRMEAATSAGKCSGIMSSITTTEGFLANSRANKMRYFIVTGSSVPPAPRICPPPETSMRINRKIVSTYEPKEVSRVLSAPLPLLAQEDP